MKGNYQKLPRLPQKLENWLRPQAQSSFLAILAISALHSKRLQKCNQIALLFFG
jgi:hypothetical protein